MNKYYIIVNFILGDNLNAKRTASVGHDMGSNARDKDNSAGLEEFQGSLDWDQKR